MRPSSKEAAIARNADGPWNEVYVRFISSFSALLLRPDPKRARLKDREAFTLLLLVLIHLPLSCLRRRRLLLMICFPVSFAYMFKNPFAAASAR